MKFPRTLAAVPLVVAAAIPALSGSAGAVDTTELTVVNGYSYSANHPPEDTVCIDDVRVQSGAAVVNVPAITTTPGSHELKVASSVGQDCSDDTVAWIITPIDLLDVPAQTLAIGWTEHVDDVRTNTVHIFEDSLECLPEGEGQIVLRNVATTRDIVADLGRTATDSTEAVALISGVAWGEEQSAPVDAGFYPESESESLIVYTSAFEGPFLGSGGRLPVNAGDVIDVYVHSGIDGPVGIDMNVRTVGVCDAPPTTVTVPEPATTVPEPTTPGTDGTRAAVPVPVQPTYAG